MTTNSPTEITFDVKTFWSDQLTVKTVYRDTLLAALSDQSLPQERRDLAALALKHYETMANQAAATTWGQVDNLLEAELMADAVWRGTRILKTTTRPDGSITVIDAPKPVAPPEPVSRVDRLALKPAKPEPAGFEPAVALPVIEPSPVEQAAINGLSVHLAQHYSPAAIAERLEKIEQEAAELRRIREQPL